MNKPLVSVICLCYNQARFVIETLESVMSQTYGNIEIIVVDDGSFDGSKKVIADFLLKHSKIPFMNILSNVGNTTAFNKGLALAKGKYIVDLACDDVLYPDQVQRQVEFFEGLKEKIGVIYSDGQYIDEGGNLLKTHFSNKRRIPYNGDIYEKVVETYFIPPQTMMIRKSVLDELGGYDESLAYEDFDFWVRSARNWEYAYQNEVSTKIRKVKGSHSATLYKKGDQKLKSTFEICLKIKKLNKTESEDQALIRRIKYEFRHAVLTGNASEASDFFSLLKEMVGTNIQDDIFNFINQFKIDWSFLRNVLVRK